MTVTVDSRGNTVTEVGEDPGVEPSAFRILKPNQDIAAVGAIITGGAASFEAAVSAPGDGLGIQLSAGGYVTIGFDSSIMPPGMFIKQLDFSSYTSSPYGDNTVSIYRDVALTRMPFNANAPQQVGTTDDNGDWLFDQADVDSLQVVITALAGPAAVQVNIDEIHSNLDYVSEPVCNLTPVADTVDPFITVTWSHSTAGADNYSHTSSQIKVYTEAQYTDPGFDPATSVPYFDSGVIPAQGVYPNTLTVPITESGIYRVYAHTAQLINDGYADQWFPGGYLQWSGWKFTGFTVTLPVTTKNLSYWNGTAWADGPVKTWNGTAFVDAPAIKIWNGSAWADSVN